MNMIVTPNLKKRAKIQQLQDHLVDLVSSGKAKVVECTLIEYFAPGLYIREFHMPADAVIVGKIHKTGHFNVITKGRLRVYTEFGDDHYELFDANNGAISFTSIPWTKRSLLVEQDAVWMTFHPTEKTDPVEIEKDLIAEGYEGFNKLSYVDVKGMIT